MLDTFEIITTSGVVLWSKSYTPLGPSLVNDFVRHVFIEERSERSGPNPSYRKDGCTIKWATAKDLGLIFVVRIPETAFHLHVVPGSTKYCRRPSTRVSFTYPG
jgi:hypothetical protein